MKRKFIPMFVGTLSLTVGLATLVAYSTQAKTNALSPSSSSVIAQGSTSPQEPMMNPSAAPKPMPPLPGLEGIDLTSQQQEQIKQISQDMQAQFEAAAPRPPQPTAEQQEKIRQIAEAYRPKIEAVFTQEQLAQLHQNQDNPNTKPAPAFGPMPGPPPNFAKLNLTAEQKEQLKQIHEQMRSEIQAILPTPPQLTDEQKAALKQLMQSYRERVEAILTSEQQQQFRQNLQRFEEHHPN